MYLESSICRICCIFLPLKCFKYHAGIHAKSKTFEIYGTIITYSVLSLNRYRWNSLWSKWGGRTSWMLFKASYLLLILLISLELWGIVSFPEIIRAGNIYGIWTMDQQDGIKIWVLKVWVHFVSFILIWSCHLWDKDCWAKMAEGKKLNLLT